MKASQFLISTQKNIPSDADVVSNQLMVRAGLIRKLANGLKGIKNRRTHCA